MVITLKVQNVASSNDEKSLKRHYETHHPDLKNLDGRELRKIKTEELKKDLQFQQRVMTSFGSTNDDGLTVSYEVSELIAEKLKPYEIYCFNAPWYFDVFL